MTAANFGSVLRRLIVRVVTPNQAAISSSVAWIAHSRSNSVRSISTLVPRFAMGRTSSMAAVPFCMDPTTRYLCSRETARLNFDEGTAIASQVPRTDSPRSPHRTVQSAITWRKTLRVLTAIPSSSRMPTRRSFQQRLPLSRF